MVYSFLLIGQSNAAGRGFLDEAQPFGEWKKKVRMLRKELNMPELPVLVGGLGDYLPLYEGADYTKNYIHINRQLEQLEKEYPNCRFVSAEGLGANPDNLHFSAEALAEFGVRYFEAFKAFGMPGAEAARDEIAEDLVRTELEQL